MAKKVSIITINYNGKDDTVDLIESFGRYETYPYEIIIIDNGSKNYGEHHVLSKYSPKPIVIRSDKNLGFAGGNNLGIPYADGDYILFLNNDTREPSKGSRQQSANRMCLPQDSVLA